MILHVRLHMEMLHIVAIVNYRYQFLTSKNLRIEFSRLSQNPRKLDPLKFSAIQYKVLSGIPLVTYTNITGTEEKNNAKKSIINNQSGA